MQTWKGGSPAPDWLDERVQDTGSGRRGSTGVILLTLFHATGSGNLVVGRLTHLHLQEVSMAIEFKPGWRKPSKILFASELPPNEQAFSFAVAQAAEYGAKLILFHAYDTLVVSATETKGLLYYDFGAAAKAEAKHLAPLAERVRAAGVECETVVKPGLAADQILTYMREEKIDRIVMGTHCPGPIGKLLVAGFCCWPGGCGKRIQQFFHSHDSVRREPLRAQFDGAGICGGVGRAAPRAPGDAACDPASGAPAGDGRAEHQPD